jgi:prolipoprotein diacylglyceryltransferase
MSNWENKTIDLFRDLIEAFLAGLVLGVILQVLDKTLTVVASSLIAGTLAGLFLILVNLRSLLEDASDLQEALTAGSIIAIVMWVIGFIGAWIGSSMVA